MFLLPLNNPYNLSLYQEAEELAPDAVCPGKNTHTVDGISKSVSNNVAPTRNDDNVISESSSKKLKRCRLTNHFKKADSKGNAEPDNTLLIKAEESLSEPDSVPKKRGRRPNSLMNPEEGYDHSWICSNEKTLNPALSKKPNDNDSDDSPSENPVSSKDGTRPPGLQPKGDETTGAPLSENDNLPDGSRHRRGRPKKGRNTGKEPEETSITSDPDEKPLKQSIVKLGAAKINKHVPVPRGSKNRRKVDDDKDANKTSGSKVLQ